MVNLTCNTTLEEMRILPGTEIPIAGPLVFHQLALIIGGGSALVAILLSLYLIMMHATHYTVPHEQKHIIRILFMVPVYATSSFLMIRYYWHAIYFQVLCDCYEAFAISSFFSLMCHYIKPDLHEQKDFFRDMDPIAPWVWPVNWFAKCCGGQRGPWRTPRSGLTWFNIIWIGVYHYCFIRVAMTVAAVVTQYYGRYCESSNSIVFSHIWIVVVQSIAVTIAMYCLIQFYVQLRNTEQLAPNQPFLKILAIKLVIFLSFWQTMAISFGTNTLDLVHPNKVLAYPDIKVGIPSLLLCVEMACCAFLHLWAFPYKSYLVQNRNGISNKGGFLGLGALWDAVNIWDVIKGFGRGMRWLFVGVKHRHKDASYSSAPRKNTMGTGVDMDEFSYKGARGDGLASLGMSQMAANNSTSHLPIAQQFRASRYGREQIGGGGGGGGGGNSSGTGLMPAQTGRSGDERAGLIQNAQPNPSEIGSPSPVNNNLSGMASPYYYESPYGGGVGGGGGDSDMSSPHNDYVVVDMPLQDPRPLVPPGHGGYFQRPGSLSTVDEESLGWSRQGSRQDMYGHHSPQTSRSQTPGGSHLQQGSGGRSNLDPTQARVGEALWGSSPQQQQQDDTGAEGPRWK